jgi:lysophospholipase L1-like esterase
MKRYLRYLTFLVYIVLFCLVGGEIVVRVFYSRFSNYNMEMWRYSSELKQPLRRQNLPFHHIPGKSGTYYGVDISTNSMGFRDREYTIDRPENTRRILVLGDSHTLGWGVALEDLFSKVLERQLDLTEEPYEVMNLGAGNYNSTMEVELFKWKGLDLDPDMVILMYFINDTEPVPRPKSAVSYAILKQSYFCSFLFDRLVRLRSRFMSGSDWSSYYESLYSPENARNRESNRESIRELVALCDQNGIELLIANLPELHGLKAYPFTYATDYIRAIAEEGGVPFVDLRPALSACEPESLWVSLEDPHANARAHAIIAQCIYEKIKQDLPLALD